MYAPAPALPLRHTLTDLQALPPAPQLNSPTNEPTGEDMLALGRQAGQPGVPGLAEQQGHLFCMMCTLEASEGTGRLSGSWFLGPPAELGLSPS